MESNKTTKIKNSTVGAYIQRSKNIHINKLIINKLAKKQNYEVPPLINTFTGRDNELNQLESLFFNEDNNQIRKKIVLCGYPGIGKSELAKQFADKCKKDGKVSEVFWIHAENENELKKEFATIKELYKNAGRQKYLFVLDNALSRNSLANFELSDDHLFLITSQKKDWGLNMQTLLLNPLTNDSAINFYKLKLNKDYKEEDKDLYLKIANFVGCIPLGLQITGAYIRETKKVHGEEFLQKYIETLQQSDIVEQNFPPAEGNPYEKSIYGAIKISIDKISSDNDIKFPYLALSTLYVCCYLDPEFIELKLLLNLSNIDKILKSENCNKITLKQSLILLDNFSLIKFIPKGSHIEIHRFTQKILRYHLAKYDPKIQFDCYSSCLEVIFKFKKYYPYGQTSDDEDKFDEDDEYSDDEEDPNIHEMTEAEKEYFKYFGYNVDTEYEDDSEEDEETEQNLVVCSEEPPKNGKEISDFDLFGDTEFNTTDPNEDNHEDHETNEPDLFYSNANTTNDNKNEPKVTDLDLFDDTEFDINDRNEAKEDQEENEPDLFHSNTNTTNDNKNEPKITDLDPFDDTEFDINDRNEAKEDQEVNELDLFHFNVNTTNDNKNKHEITDLDRFGDTEFDINDPNEDNREEQEKHYSNVNTNNNDELETTDNKQLTTINYYIDNNKETGELHLFNSYSTNDNNNTLERKISDFDYFGQTDSDFSTNDNSENKPPGPDPFWLMAFDFITPKILQHADENLDAFSNFYFTNKHILLNDSAEDSVLQKILHSLVETGCIKCIQLIYNDFDDSAKKFVGKFNLSYYSYNSRQSEILKFLLNFDDEGKKVEHGRLINEAAFQANFKMVKIFVEHNPELIHARYLGNTPIFEYFRGISEYQHDYSNIKDVLNVLKCKENKDMRDCSGNTVLHVAIALFSENIIESLITDYDMDVNAQNKDGETPLHYLIYISLGSFEKQTLNKITKLFVVHGASLSIKNESGLTVMEYTEAFGVYWSARYIGSIIFYFTNCTKDFTNFPLHRAVFFYNLDEIIFKDINCLDNDHDTALHVAAIEWNLEAMKILLNHKADFTIRNKMGNTALFNLFFGARYFKNINLEEIHEVLCLLKLEKHVDDVNNKQETLLHLAAASAHEELVALLIENYNFDINIQDSEGKTPLHTLITELSKFNLNYSTNEKVRDTIMKLKIHGASLDIVDNTGMTVIKLAQFYNLEYVLIILLFDDNNIDRLTVLTEDHIREYVENYFLLHYCIKYNQIATLILLLNLNINVNMQTKKQNSALHAACLTGNLKAIKILTDYNADLNLKNKHGDIPLFCFTKTLVEHKHLNTIEIEQILDVLQCKKYRDFTDTSGKSLLHIAVKFLNADLVELLLTKYNFDPNKTDLRNKTAVQKLTDQLPFTHYLYPPDIANMRRIAETLKQNGAFLDTNTTLSEYSYNQENDSVLCTIISYIVLFEDEDTIIEKLTILFRKLGGRSSEYVSKLRLIHYAIAVNYIKLLNKLIEQGVYNIWHTASNNVSPLHVAAFNWNLKATRILIYCKAKLNEDNLDGDTPLFSFYKGGLEQDKVNLDKVNKILDLLKIEENYNCTNKNAETLLHVAATSFQSDLIELLINKININSQDSNGRTPLHAFILKLSQENINTSKRWVRIFNTAVTLKLNGSSLDIKDENGFTPVELGYRKKVSYILIYILFEDKYANDLRNIFEKLDEETKTTIFKLNILQNALRMNKLEVLDVLLENNSDVNCKFDDENTLLHLAAYNWNVKAINILLKHGADLNVKNDIGKTPLNEFLEAPRFYDVNMDNMHQILSLLKCQEDKSNENWTILHSAAMSLNADLVHVLLDEFNANAVDKHKNTPLHIFIWSLTQPHDKKLEDIIQTLEILLNGSCLDLKNEEGLTPFEFAQQEKLDYLLPYLVKIEPEPEPEYLERKTIFSSIFNTFVALCCVLFYLYFTYLLIVILL